MILSAKPFSDAPKIAGVVGHNLLTGASRMDNVEKMLTALIGELVELRIDRRCADCEVEDFNAPRAALLQFAREKLLAEDSSSQQRALLVAARVPGSDIS